MIKQILLSVGVALVVFWLSQQGSQDKSSSPLHFSAKGLVWAGLLRNL